MRHPIPTQYEPLRTQQKGRGIETILRINTRNNHFGDIVYSIGVDWGTGGEWVTEIDTPEFCAARGASAEHPHSVTGWGGDDGGDVAVEVWCGVV